MSTSPSAQTPLPAAAVADNSPATRRLLGDIGGTNARFALQAGPGASLTHIHTLACADHPTLEAAMRAYLAALDHPPVQDCAIGIANPVTGDHIRMTNHHWGFSIRELRASLGLRRLVVVNDFTALALALPLLPASSLRQVGGESAASGAPVALLGAGTGLGVSGLLPLGRSGVNLPIAGEGGHVTLAAETAEEFACLQRLQQQYGHASAERVLSGPGLADLYQALREHRGGDRVPGLVGADVTERALRGQEPLALDTLDMFCSFLGSVAGNLALTLGARGGVYIGGGIVPRFGTWFDRSSFRARFESKGRFRAFLAAIPVWVIDAPTSPALEGAAQAFDLPE